MHPGLLSPKRPEPEFQPMNLVIEAVVRCPYCGEEFPFVVDTSEGDYETTEDCTVCCRPIAFVIACEPGALHAISGEIG